MKTRVIMMACIAALGLLSSCRRSSNDVWEDTKTCKRYLGKGVRSLFGQHVDSRNYASYYDNWDDPENPSLENYNSNRNQDFTTLTDNNNPNQQISIQEYVPISRESPGEEGSAIPGINGFEEPSGALAALFQSIHFETDKYTVQGGENLEILGKISDFLIKNSNTYVFIEGHADERGPAAYNLALGSKRAHSVRVLLVQNGVNPDQLFTISYGKEQPLVMGNDATSWRQNRRAQFKTFNRR